MNGRVYLAGAGPGDPELMTLKALAAIERADLVLYDDLVSEAILARIPATARAVSVGKRAGRDGPSQEEINRRMIAAARAGCVVVRLKGGDPLVFGRGGEEIEGLREAGVEFEIVPGVTAALAAAAAAKIPLTDRRIASKLVLLSAHRAGEWSLDEWRAAASDGATVVVYMPGENYIDLGAELLAGGMDEDTPVALISNASRPTETIRTTTLGGLPELGRLPSPSVLLIGAVAAFHQPDRADEAGERLKVEANSAGNVGV